MGRRNRILLREQHLQNLENEQITDHTISNDNPNIIAPVSGIRRSSRKRFFQNLDVEGTSADIEDRRAYESRELDEMGHRNRMLLREQYLQNLENEQRTDHSISNDNPNIIAPVSGIRRSSRKKLFQNLDVQGTSADFKDGRTYKSGELDAVANTLDSSSSFGQAHYQRQKQGVVIEYKDFGDDTFQCAHCNAYYWRDGMNTRGVYTGCCKAGQVRLQPSNQTPSFLEYLLE
ncbi:PREDICTED: uncharacterized protein LOC101299897 [Fragaria vesca subsp. vesca]